MSDLETKLSGGETAARTYSPKDAYVIEEFVRHPTFGVGMVVGLPSAQKMEVAFRDGRKILVHQRGDGPPPPSTLTRPVRTEEAPGYVTDAPPPGGKGGTE